MHWKRVLVAVVAIVVVVGAVGTVAVLTGLVPTGGNGDATVAGYPTASPGQTYSGSASGGGNGTNAAAGTSTPPFTFTIDSISTCGQTCRKVTATIHNQQSTSASNVTVYSIIYAGNQTRSGDRIWAGKQPIGTLAAGGSYTGTQTVQLSFSDAYSVQQHGGWITVVTTVQSASKTVSFTSHRNVT